MKLIQKAFLKGTREFEIDDDVVHVRIKKPFKEEKLTIGLSTLNPEPVINQPYLEFQDSAKSKTLLSLFLNNPGPREFNTFVDALKQRVTREFNTVTSIKATSQPEGLAANSYDEPPEFEEFGHNRVRDKVQIVNAERVEDSIQLLEKYLDDEKIKPLLSALEALKAEPQNESYFMEMEKAFNDLGILQGAVLTYAPYLSVLLADDPFGKN